MFSPNKQESMIVVITILLILFIFFLFSILSTFYDVYDDIGDLEKDYKGKSIKNDIFCKRTECFGLIQNNRIFLYKEGTLQKTNIPSSNHKIFRNIYFDTNFYKFNLKIKNKYVMFSLFNELDKNIFMFKITIPFITLFLLIYTSQIIYYEKRKNKFINSANEVLASYRSITILLENISHEINTPIEVILSKINKIEKKCQKDLTVQFHYIYEKIKKIVLILNKMEEVKQIRKKENLTIGDIIGQILILVHISDSSFDYKIDKKLYQYRCKNISDSNVANIFLNQLRNSLKNTSNNIEFRFEGFFRGKLKILIIDNGNGVDINVREKLFKTNKDSLNNDSETYLSTEILKYFNGDIQLVSSERNKGTIFRITVPATFIQ